MNAPIGVDQLQDGASEFLARLHRPFINGEWVDATGSEVIDVVNPATGEVFARVQAAVAQDIDRAVRAARAAFDEGPWPRMAPAERSGWLLKLADAVERAAPEIAYLETLDNGMPFTSGMRAAGIGAAYLRYFASWCGKVTGQVHNVAVPNVFAYSVKEPVGVVAAITPWNFPFVMEVQKLSQALAAGCTVVLKPAELTPLSALKFAELVQECDFPKGVINIVVGRGDQAGKALVEHELVDKISFTGSTATGKWIVAAAAGNLKRVTLELGGKSPTIIFDDANLDQAIPGAAMSVFANSGQVCVAGSRLFVHRSVYDRVVAGISSFAASLKVAPGLDPASQLGPLVSQGQFDRVASYIQSGVEEGAEIVHGGERVGDKGYFMQPTVIANTHPDMRMVREEIFGPVVAAIPFDDDDLDAIARQANDTSYGLAAYLWTRDVSKVHKLAGKIRAGSIQVNGGLALDPAVPFGGFKQSGWGRENGGAGIEAFLETKSVLVRL
ncbi:MAG: betaine-aldehyde dehydrogenase [Bradyrhizobium sp.]|nr:betaine-aldehyde dehydrogenase [Bradyrhizobium sp.]